MKVIRFISITFFMFLTTQIQAQINQQIPNAGNVNWQNQMIQATGIGAPNPNVAIGNQKAGTQMVGGPTVVREAIAAVMADGDVKDRESV